MSMTAAEEAQLRELLAQQAAILSLADSEAAIISNLGATDVSLSDLTAAAALNDADLMLVRQGTTDKSVNPLIFDVRYLRKSGDTATGPMAGPTPATGNRSTLYATMQKFSDEFGASLTANGWQKLPSGMIIQWGTCVPSVAGTLVTYPITFPSACFGVFVVPNENIVLWPFITATPTVNFTARSPSVVGATYYFSYGY